MPVAAPLIMAGATIGSGVLGYMGAKDAASKQADSLNNALNFQRAVYQNNQANLSPWMKFGRQAVASLSDLYGLGGRGGQGVNEAFQAFTNLPAYQFPYQQGLRALNMNLNAQGKQQSGAMAKEAQQFGQGLASTYLMNNYVQPLTTFSEQGRGAAGALAGVNSNMASTIGNTYGSLGAAQAGGVVGATNALTGGIQGAASPLSMYSLLAQNSNGTGNPLSLSYGTNYGSTGGTGLAGYGGFY